MAEEEKLQIFNKSFRKLTEITVWVIISSIFSIEIDDEVVTDRSHIQQFVENADRDFYDLINKHIESQKNKFGVKPRTVITLDEDREKGAPESFEMPLTFDQSHFFG
jgi:succinate dehydrogenase flavin-adding protein (antitoxin of CptAB toxin-antitoxin module)